MRPLKIFLQNDRGVTATEYALIATVIVFAIVVAVTLIGSKLNTIFTIIGSTLSSVL